MSNSNKDQNTSGVWIPSEAKQQQMQERRKNVIPRPVDAYDANGNAQKPDAYVPPKFNPHPCNPRVDDFIFGMKQLKTQGTFTALVRCLAGSKLEPVTPYMFLDNDDVERSLGITKLPNAFFNLRRGWYTAQDDEIMRQHWEQNPLEKARRDAEAAALQQQQQQQQTTKQPE